MRLGLLRELIQYGQRFGIGRAKWPISEKPLFSIEARTTPPFTCLESNSQRSKKFDQKRGGGSFMSGPFVGNRSQPEVHLVSSVAVRAVLEGDNEGFEAGG
jgi:hypothetical protein